MYINEYFLTKLAPYIQIWKRVISKAVSRLQILQKN